MMSTVSVEWTRRLYIPKYERYLIRKSRVKAHNPAQIGAKVGDRVRIVETRPISKTKKFLVTEIVQ
ncbi:MAG: 30S ribosomal protein S17 [Nitrosarchaeum sp.]|nr:30S ribosomal protein S17 [Nitrosarchaeum sp.]